MSIRILAASLSCAALVALAVPAGAAMRPEIAQQLIVARFSTPTYAWKEISAAEAVPNQTAEEKARVAGAKRRLMLDQGAFTNEPLGIQEAPLPLEWANPVANSGASSQQAEGAK